MKNTEKYSLNNKFTLGAPYGGRFIVLMQI